MKMKSVIIIKKNLTEKVSTEAIITVLNSLFDNIKLKFLDKTLLQFKEIV